jgi:basic amino acid/polyamine antiporter, APA family
VAFVTQFGKALFRSAGAKALSLCVLIYVLGGLAASTMTSPRVTFAPSQTGAFFPLFGTPANGILLHTSVSLGVLFLGTFDRPDRRTRQSTIVPLYIRIRSFP